MPLRRKKTPEGGQVEQSYLKSFETYAQDIADELLENFGKDRDGYIFAISAKWGAGKTKLLQLIEPILKSNGYEVATFNAWQYTQDAETLRRAFLKSIEEQLKWNWRDLFSPKKRTLRRLDYEETRSTILFPPIGYLLIIILILLALAIINSNIYVHFYHLLSRLITTIEKNSTVTYLVTFVLAILALPTLLHVQRKSNKVSSVDDFEGLFSKITKRHKKLIIFIDDLDRCTPEGAKLVLDTLKTFFLKQGVAYVVTGDHTVLERYMGDQLVVEPIYDDEGVIDQKSTDIEKTIEGRRFMQKIFNVYWKLPVLEPSENELLINKNLDTVKGLTDTDKDVIKQLALGYLDKTPREIKRFSSLLSFSLKVIQTRIDNLSKEEDEGSKQISHNLETVKKYPALLAKILLMQEKFDLAFYYFSEGPDKYQKLEKARLTNKADEDIRGFQNALLADMGSTRYERFSEFLSNAPTFHSPDGLTLIASPELFFYYSGFAGAAQAGLLSEDFLTRYVTIDDKLVEDFKNTTPDDFRETILKSGVENIDKIDNAEQLSQAIVNTLAFFKIEGLGHQELLASFVQTKGMAKNWPALTEEQRETLLADLVGLALRDNDQVVLDVLMREQPWATKLTSLITHLNFATLDEALFSTVKDTLIGSSLTAETSQFRKQTFEQCLDVLVNAKSHEMAIIQRAHDRLADQSLNLSEFSDEASFNRIVSSLSELPDGDKGKSAPLLQLLNKDSHLWEGISKPNTIMQFKKKSKLQKRYGDTVSTIFNSWKSS
jgi:hypothetical protein